MRPPAMTPTIAQKMRSSTSSLVQVLPGLAAWRRASHQAAANPTTYMMPYQWICKGPRCRATGSISGYRNMLPILSGNVAEQGLQIAGLGHGRVDRMVGRLSAKSDEPQVAAGVHGGGLQQFAEHLGGQMPGAGTAHQQRIVAGQLQCQLVQLPIGRDGTRH